MAADRSARDACPTRRPAVHRGLSCPPVGTLSPGERVVFEMRVRIPATAPLGRDALIWTLAPASYLPPIAVGVIFVRR